MSETDNPFSTSIQADDYRPRKLVNWRRRLAWLGSALLFLTLSLWLFVSSTWFFRDLVLPKIARGLNAEITAAQVEWSPFSGVAMNDVRLVTTGETPLFQAARVELKFSAWDLWNGRTDIARVTLAQPVLHVIEDAEGHSNLDPLLEALRNKKKNPTATWRLRDLTIRDGALNFQTPGTQFNLAGITADLDQAAPGETGQLTFNAKASHARGDWNLGGELEAKLDITINPDGQWEGATVRATVKIHPGYEVAIQGGLSPSKLDNTVVVIEKNGQTHGRLRAEGKQHPDNGDWKITLKAENLDRELLLPLGIDIADSVVQADHTIHLIEHDGQPTLMVEGVFLSESFRVVKDKFTTPAAHVELRHAFKVDPAVKTITVTKVTLVGAQQKRELLNCELSNPSHEVTWRDGIWIPKPLMVKLRLNDLDLAQWRPLLEPHATAGRLSVTLETELPKDGKVEFRLDATGLQLSGRAGRWSLNNESVSVKAHGSWGEGDLSLNNSRLDHVMHPAPNRQIRTLLDGVVLNLGQGKDDQRFRLSARWKREAGEDTASGRLENNGTFVLDNGGALESIQAEGSVYVEDATGTFADAKDLSANLEGHWTTELLKHFTADFQLDGEPAGHIESNGGLNPARDEWVLNADVRNVDRRVLNFLGSDKGLDFRDTVLNATNQFHLSTDTRKWRMAGRVTADQFSVARGNATTPTVKLAADYQLEVDWPGKAARLDRFTLSGTRGDQDILESRLLQPLRLDWSEGAAQVPESRLEIKLHAVDLAEWRPLLGGPARAGLVDSAFTLTAKANGRQMDFELAATGRDFIGEWAGHRLEKASIGVTSRGTILDLQTLQLEAYSVSVIPAGGKAWELTGQGRGGYDGNRTVSIKEMTGRLTLGAQPAGNFTASGNGDMASRVGWVKLDLRDVPARLIQPWWPANHLKTRLLSAHGDAAALIRVHPGDWGEVNATAQLRDVRLEDLNGSQPLPASAWTARFDGALRKAGEYWGIRIDRCEGGVVVEGEPAGNFLVKGEATLGPGTYEADLKYSKLENIQREVLRLLRLDRMGLRTIDVEALNYVGRTQLYTGGRGGLNGRIVLVGLRLTDPEGLLPAGPTDIECDATLAVQARSGALWDVNATRMNGSISLGAGRRGTFDASGWYLAREGRGFFEGQFKDFDQDMARPMLKGTMPPGQLHRAKASGKGTLQIDPDVGFTFQGTAKVSGWQLLKPGWETPSSPLDGTVVFNLNRRRKLLTIRKLDVQLAKTEHGENALRLSGWMDFSRVGQVSARMKLASNSVDLDSVLKSLRAIPTSGKQRESDIRYILQADKIHWRGLSAADFNGTLAFSKNQTIISPMRMTLEGGRVFDTHLTIDRSTSPFSFDLKFKGTRMKARPVLAWMLRDHFWTQQAEWGQLDAYLRLKWVPAGNGRVTFTEISGLGEEVPFLGEQSRLARDRACLKITGAEVSLTGGKKENDPLIPALVKLGLNGLSTALGVPELNTAKMKTTLLVGRVDGNHCRLDLIIGTAMYDAKSAGVITLQDPLGDSPINLPVQVTLKPAVARKFKILGGLLRRNAPETLPVFLTIVGTLGKHDQKIDSLKVAAIYAASAAGRITNLPVEIIGSIPFPLNPFRSPKPPKK